MSKQILLETLQWLDGLEYGIEEDFEPRFSERQETEEVIRPFQNNISFSYLSEPNEPRSKNSSTLFGDISLISNISHVSSKSSLSSSISRRAPTSHTKPFIPPPAPINHRTKLKPPLPRQSKSTKRSTKPLSPPVPPQNEIPASDLDISVYLDDPPSGYEYDSEPDERLYRSSSLQYNFRKWRTWLSHWRSDPDKSVLREKLMTSEHMMLVRIPAWRSYLLTLRGFHSWRRYHQLCVNEKERHAQGDPTRLKFTLKLQLTIRFWRLWQRHRYYHRRQTLKHWQRRIDYFQPLKKFMIILKRLLLRNHLVVWKRRSRWPKVAIQRKLYQQHLVFDRLQEYLKRRRRDQDDITQGKLHYIRKGLQRWRRNYFRRCPALPPLPPLSSIRFNPKVMGTNSYYYRLRKRHFQDLIRQLKLQVRVSTAMAFARHFYRSRRLRRGIRQLLYYRNHRWTIAHHNNVIKGVIKGIKRKSFHHWRRQIKLWYDQYKKLSHVARVFHLRKIFQYFKKLLSYKTYAFQRWSIRVYYHHQTRRSLSNHLIPYYTRRKERKCLHKKALLYYKRKYFIRFLTLLRRRKIKRNQLHHMIRYYHGSKVIKQWKERTETQITDMIRLRRSILRSSINKQLKYLYYWKEKINHQIQLRRRFYYYQQLKRFSYFSNSNHSYGIMSPISSPSPTTTTSDTPISISTTMYKVKLQQLRFYFHAWKIDYHGYQQKVSACLKRFSWKYQIELSYLTFSHWQQVYERRACLRQRKKIAFQQWRNKSRKMRMWLDHWASLLLVDEGIHKLYPRLISSYFSSFPLHFSQDSVSPLALSNERASRNRIKQEKEWKPFLSLSSEVLKEKIHDKLTSFPAFLWIYVEERFDRNQIFQRLRRFKAGFLNQLKIKAAITSTSSSIRLWKNLQSNLSSNSFSLTLPQMSLCRLVFHRWYERYLNKALYYQSAVPRIHKRLLTQLPQYPLIEQQINQRIPYHIQRRVFRQLHQIYRTRHQRIISIQGRLYVRPLFYHWIRVYNYYAMKKLLQLPTPLDNVKAIALSPMHSTMIEDKQELAQHLAQLKKKIAKSRGSYKNSTKENDNSVKAGSGKETRVISESNKALNVSISSNPITKRAPVKLIGNLSYTERYRSPIIEKKQSSSNNRQRNFSQERKEQRHESMKREPIQSNASHTYDASESILDTTIATSDNYHLQLPSYSVLTMTNSQHPQHTQINAGELQNTTVLIHPSAAPRHFHNNHYTHPQHSLLNETIIEEDDEEEENEEYSNDSLTENSSLTGSYYHQKDNNNNNKSLNQTRIDYHYTYQQFIQERSYLGRYTRQSKK